VSALQTQVSELSAQLQPSPTPAPAPPTSTVAPANPIVAMVEPLLDELAPDVAAAEIEVEPETPPVPTATRAPTRVPTPRPAATPTRTPRPLTAEDASPCEIGQIKGNRDSKIYHVPTGSSYARTKNKVECFASEGDAQAAGYRRARN
jgi:hypothetical protein